MGTDARERLTAEVAETICDGGNHGDCRRRAAAAVAALLSEGCRGDLAEAAGLPDWDQVAALQSHLKGAERLLRDARRETALKIADAIRKHASRPNWDIAYQDALTDAEAIARSFAEKSSAPPPTVVGEGPDGPIVRLTPGQAAMIKLPRESTDE
ncbi:MAG: hypothetical protein J2P24_00220 [Streptosporangiales bacterium]|nr:hypothetical protein [Streptosporangiales bacterium]